MYVENWKGSLQKVYFVETNAGTNLVEAAVGPLVHSIFPLTNGIGIDLGDRTN